MELEEVWRRIYSLFCRVYLSSPETEQISRPLETVSSQCRVSHKYWYISIALLQYNICIINLCLNQGEKPIFCKVWSVWGQIVSYPPESQSIVLCVVCTLDPGFLVQFSRIFCRRAKHLWGISLNKIRILRHILFVLAGLGRELALVSQASFTLHTFDILPPAAAEAAQPSSLFMFCSFNTWKHQTQE